MNGGFGFTYKFSQFSNERSTSKPGTSYFNRRGTVYRSERRFVFTDATNFYPANSNRTTYIPIKFGIRF